MGNGIMLKHRRLFTLCITLALVVTAIPVGTSLASSAALTNPDTSSVADFACPTTSSNSYLQGGIQQWDYDNPVRPAWNHADKNLALRSYAATTALQDFVDYGLGDSTQPPQFA